MLSECCKDCEKREIWCHGKCKEYHDYRKELEELKKKEKLRVLLPDWKAERKKNYKNIR